jgi:hypothetical protein
MRELTFFSVTMFAREDLALVVWLIQPFEMAIDSIGPRLLEGAETTKFILSSFADVLESVDQEI